MTNLRILDSLACEYQKLGESDLGPGRRKKEETNIITRIHKVLTPSIRRSAKQKGMLGIQDDVDQHAYLAINTALGTWNSELSSFSTHVHWQLRAEMKSLELYHFPERRKVSQNINVQMVYINQVAQADSENGSEFGDILNLDPEGFLEIENNISQQMDCRNIEYALSRMIISEVGSYLNGKCLNRGGILRVMRNIHIYIQQKIGEENTNLVGDKHSITRERVRQVTMTMHETFSRHIRDIVARPRSMTIEEKDAWELSLAIYKEERGQSIPLTKCTNPRTSEEIENCYLNLPEDHMKAKIAAMLAGIAFVQSVPSVSQERSRAIPPVTAVKPSVEKTKTQTSKTDERVTGRVVANDTERAASKREFEGVEPDNGKIWVVKISEHPNQYDLKTAASSAIQRHPELKVYRPAIIRNKDRNTLSLGFGGLNQKEATRVCAIMQSRGQACSRIRVGQR